MIETWMWVVGGVVIPIVLGATGFWWRVESDQNRKLEKLRECNGKDHREIRNELSGLKEESHERHVELLDKVTEVWQHMVKHK
jgi:hypothetical protein